MYADKTSTTTVTTESEETPESAVPKTQTELNTNGGSSNRFQGACHPGSFEGTVGSYLFGNDDMKSYIQNVGNLA